MSKQKTVSIAELRKMKDAQLHKMLKDTVLAIAKSELEIATKKTKNTSGARAGRRLIAHIKTVLYEKRMLQKLQVTAAK